jgi:hypothetical protein
MHNRRRDVSVSLLLLAAVSGCGGTLGPLITDVRWGDGGELVVTRCMLEIGGGGSITPYSITDCKRTVQPHPNVGAGVIRARPRSGAHGQLHERRALS